MGLREKRKAETRQLILEAAIKVFAQFGFEGASTRDIAQRAGVAQGLVTYHFENKDNLWRETVKAVLRDFALIMVELPEKPSAMDARQAFREFVLRYAKFCLQSSGIPMLLYQQSGLKDERFNWLVKSQIMPAQAGIWPLYDACTSTQVIKPMSFELFCFSLGGLCNTYFALSDVYRVVTDQDPQDDNILSGLVDHLEQLMLV